MGLRPRLHAAVASRLKRRNFKKRKRGNCRTVFPRLRFGLLTPELRKEVLKIVADEYTIGPLYTPPRTKAKGKPVINLPGDGGGANWPAAAFDPDSGLYIPSASSPRQLITDN